MDDLEATQRQLVGNEALSWIGTRYHHQGRIKAKPGDPGGTDCGQFIYMTFFNVGLIPEMPNEYYTADWHLHRDLEVYMGIVQRFCREMDPSEPMLPGDIVLYKIARVHAHGAIVAPSGWPNVVHALKDAQRVQEDLVTAGRLANRPQRHFSFWGRTE